MEKYSLREPIKGDIVRIEINNGLYHYGIYLGDDEVIQYGFSSDAFSVDKSNVEVNISPMSDFAKGKMVQVRDYSLIEKMKKNKADVAISKAKSRLGEKKYDLINNNCEHFVNECVFNKHISLQAEKYNK